MTTNDFYTGIPCSKRERPARVKKQETLTDMKKQRIRKTKLGPCVSRMRHRFLKKSERYDYPPSYYREMPHEMIVKKCLNCHGQFWFHEPFTESIRNATPAVAEILRQLEKIAEEYREVEKEKEIAARKRSEAAKRGALTRKRRAAARKAAETRKRNAEKARRAERRNARVEARV